MSDVIGSSRLCSQFATIKEQVVMGDTRTEDFSKILTGLDLCYDWDSKGLPELTRRQPQSREPSWEIRTKRRCNY